MNDGFGSGGILDPYYTDPTAAGRPDLRADIQRDMQVDDDGRVSVDLNIWNRIVTEWQVAAGLAQGRAEEPNIAAIEASAFSAGRIQGRAEALDVTSPLLDIQHEEDGSWSVSVRAMPGHVGCADTIEEAFVEAADAAEAWVAALAQPVPDSPMTDDLIERVRSAPLDDEPLRFDVNWNKGFAAAVEALRAALAQPVPDSLEARLLDAMKQWDAPDFGAAGPHEELAAYLASRLRDQPKEEFFKTRMCGTCNWSGPTEEFDSHEHNGGW